MKTILFITLMFLPVLTSCRNETTNVSESSLIPEDAVPFEEDGHIYLNSVLNGVDSCRLIFDTGADILYLDKDFCRLDSLDMTSMTKIKASMGGVGGNMQLVDLIMDTITVTAENLEEHFGRTAIIGLRNIVGCRADGIIGLDKFMDKVLEINFEHSYMRLLDTIPQEMMKGYVGKPIRLGESGRVYTDIDLLFHEKKVTGSFIIDLGSGNGVSMTRGFALENNLDELDVKKTGHYLNGGIGGNSSNVFIVSDAVIIGQDTVRNVEVSYSMDDKGALGLGKDYAGLAGMGILSRYNIMMDLKGKMLYLAPYQADKNVNIVDRGFRTVDRTDIGAGWIINYLESNSSADAADLHLGDTIRAVNGYIVDINSYKFLKPLLDTASVIELEIKGRDRNTRIVSL